jgi:hypothetical protein
MCPATLSPRSNRCVLVKINRVHVANHESIHVPNYDRIHVPNYDSIHVPKVWGFETIPLLGMNLTSFN